MPEPSSFEVPKRSIAIQIEKMVGYVPPGLGDLLSILVHPDVLPLTKLLIRAAEQEDSRGELS